MVRLVKNVTPSDTTRQQKRPHYVRQLYFNPAAWALQLRGVMLEGNAGCRCGCQPIFDSKTATPVPESANTCVENEIFARHTDELKSCG